MDYSAAKERRKVESILILGAAIDPPLMTPPLTFDGRAAHIAARVTTPPKRPDPKGFDRFTVSGR